MMAALRDHWPEYFMEAGELGIFMIAAAVLVALLDHLNSPAGAGFWVYCVAPPLGMLAAAEVYLRIKGASGVRCAKLHHENSKRCIFCLYPHRYEGDRVISD